MRLLRMFAVAAAASAISIGLKATVAEPAVRGAAVGITPSALAGVGIGATPAQVRKRWGPPTQIQRTRLRSGEYAFVYPNATFLGPAGFVIFRGGRAMHVNLSLYGMRLATRKGDGEGTTIARFRVHWPNARRAEPGLYYLPATHPGYVLMFLFIPYDGLASVDLITPQDLTSCVIQHGSC